MFRLPRFFARDSSSNKSCVNRGLVGESIVGFVSCCVGWAGLRTPCARGRGRPSPFVNLTLTVCWCSALPRHRGSPEPGLLYHPQQLTKTESPISTTPPVPRSAPCCPPFCAAHNCPCGLESRPRPRPAPALLCQYRLNLLRRGGEAPSTFSSCSDALGRLCEPGPVPSLPTQTQCVSPFLDFWILHSGDLVSWCPGAGQPVPANGALCPSRNGVMAPMVQLKPVPH